MRAARSEVNGAVGGSNALCRNMSTILPFSGRSMTCLPQAMKRTMMFFFLRFFFAAFFLRFMMQQQMNLATNCLMP